MTDKVFVPPIKTQGIKTKIVPLIKEYAFVNDDTTWVEPFFGSGVVGFNVANKKAIFADSNPYLVDFYNAIKIGDITAKIVREFLQENGAILTEKDEEYYYEVRDRFNAEHRPLDFLFMNRSCFNGMIRFNKAGDFNVPYGHKPERFAKAYVTKITNQVMHVEQLLKKNDWVFICQDFEKTIAEAPDNSFIYCDPPYIGRHVDYYDSWDEENELKLCEVLKRSGHKFMLSTWDHNEYRQNEYIDSIWSFCYKVNKDHFYHVGAKESNRAPMVEALLMNYEPKDIKEKLEEQIQISI